MQTNEINQAIAARDAGMQTAAEHADAVHENWSQLAYKFLLGYLGGKVFTPFMGEDVRNAAEAAGFPMPPHARAWGAVMIRAAKDGFIHRIGIAPVKNVKAHRANASVWEVKREAA